MTATETEITERVARLAAVQARVSELTAEADALKGWLRTEVGIMPRRRYGDVSLSITEIRRFSPPLAVRVLTPEELGLCSITTLDAKRAKDTLPHERYGMCLAPGTPMVRLG